MKITPAPKLTAILTAHGKTRSYLHRFKIIETPECPWASGNQTVEHIIYECCKLNYEREKLIAQISKEETWPVTQSALVKKYLKQFTHFANSIEYDKL